MHESAGFNRDYGIRKCHLPKPARDAPDWIAGDRPPGCFQKGIPRLTANLNQKIGPAAAATPSGNFLPSPDGAHRFPQPAREKCPTLSVSIRVERVIRILGQKRFRAAAGMGRRRASRGGIP
jgi:hypothetical protein